MAHTIEEGHTGMKVYVITDGEYSDYHIEAVFTDKRQAELYCATHKGNLEEYTADESHIETDKKVVHVYRGFIGADGEGIRNLQHVYALEGELETGIKSFAPEYGSRFKYHIVIVLERPSREKAQKIARDMLFAEKAKEAGV